MLVSCMNPLFYTLIYFCMLGFMGDCIWTMITLMALFGSIRYSCAYLLFCETSASPQTLKSFDFKVISHQQNINYCKSTCFGLYIFFVSVLILRGLCLI